MHVYMKCTFLRVYDKLGFLTQISQFTENGNWLVQVRYCVQWTHSFVTIFIDKVNDAGLWHLAFSLYTADKNQYHSSSMTWNVIITKDRRKFGENSWHVISTNYLDCYKWWRRLNFSDCCDVTVFQRWVYKAIHRL